MFQLQIRLDNLLWLNYCEGDVAGPDILLWLNYTEGEGEGPDHCASITDRTIQLTLAQLQWGVGQNNLL